MKKQTRSAQRPKKKTFTFQNQPADISWSGCKDCGGDELVIKGNVATHTCPTPKTEIVRGYNAIADVPPPPHPNEC